MTATEKALEKARELDHAIHQIKPAHGLDAILLDDIKRDAEAVLKALEGLTDDPEGEAA